MVKIFETCYYVQYKNTINKTTEVDNDRTYYYDENTKLEYLTEAVNLFFQFNYDNLYSDLINRINRDRKLELLMGSVFQMNKPLTFDGHSNRDITINEIKIDRGKKLPGICRLAIANIKCEDENFERSMEGTPHINAKRYTTFSKILNLSRGENANLLGMPECSVPYDLVPMFAKFGATNYLASVIGLEHWRVENVSYNFIVTILPLKIDNVNDALVIYRLKNHYSQEEARSVLNSGSDLKVPVPKIYRYDLINWNNLYFTNFYCYELANISHRSLFVSLVDLIVASEWNSDTNYFSGIVETTSREIHCYFMQVNTSDHGDSRITIPSKTDSKNQIQIKGGENDTILIGKIDIEKLRKFQYKKYGGQKDDKSFKPTPPDFDQKNVKKRMDNEFVLQKLSNTIF